MSVHSAPIHVMSMLTVITPWDPITVRVTLNTLEMAPHAQVNSWIIHYYFNHILLSLRNATRVSNALFLTFRKFVCLLLGVWGVHRWHWNGRNFKTLIVLKCFSSASVVFFFSDFDECANNIDNCDVNAYCNNTVGSFNCTCKSGYTGNGTTCAGKYDYLFSIEVLLFIFHTL